MRLALCFACFSAAAVPGTSADARPQPHGGGVHAPPGEQKLYLSCRVDAQQEPIMIEAALELSTPTTAAELDQVVELPAPLMPIRVTKYLPKAAREQSFTAYQGDKANPGIEISIVGATHSYRQWLVANDRSRNRLSSLIGAWRYMAVADKKERDELFAQFENELTREPMLRVSGTDGREAGEVPAKAGAVAVLDKLGCRIEVREFYAHFGMDQEVGRPANLSDKRVNPAALVEIEHDGKQGAALGVLEVPGFSAGRIRKATLQDHP